MLANVLPKLTNLKVFRCHLDSDASKWLLGVLEKSHPKLQGLVIQYCFLIVDQIVPHGIFLADQIVSSRLFPHSIILPGLPSAVHLTGSLKAILMPSCRPKPWRYIPLSLPLPIPTLLRSFPLSIYATSTSLQLFTTQVFSHKSWKTDDNWRSYNSKSAMDVCFLQYSVHTRDHTCYLPYGSYHLF